MSPFGDKLKRLAQFRKKIQKKLCIKNICKFYIKS